MDIGKFGIGLVGFLEKLKTERQIKSDIKTLKEINIPLVGKLLKTITNAQLKKDIESVTATVDLTAKASKKGLSTSVKDIVKQAQEIVNKNDIKLHIGDVNNQKLDDIIIKLKQLSQSGELDTTDSVSAINREAKAMLEIIDSARKAALEKLEFAGANSEVRESADNTVDAIVRERNAMNSLDDINYILNNVNINAEQGESVFRRFGNTLSQAFTTYTIANLLEEAIYEIIDAGREGVEVVKELNDVATSLRMATGGSIEETNALVDSYNDLGQELGAITSDVSESADAWLRQGHSIADTNTLITDSMMLSKIANLESAESTEYLTSIMQAYKLKADEVVDTVSKLSAVDLESASDAGGLAKAMSRCASAAEMAGVSMDTLIGYIATVKEVTQDSDEAVGNMFKSVFSRMNQIRAGKFVDLETGESLNDTEKVLNKIGIVTRDVNNQLIDSEQILDSIGRSWETYDSNTQKALATAVAGTYQYNKFIALMQSYADAMNYANISAGSKGVAEDKFGYYLDSLEAKTNSLQASLENLATTTLSDELYGSVLDTSKAVVDLIANTGVLKGLLIGLGTSVSIYGFQQITNSLGDITQGFANLNEAMSMTRSGAVGINDMQRLISLTSGLSQSQTRLLLSTNNLTDAQKTAILMNQGLTQAEAQQTIQTWGVATAQNGATAATVTFTGALRGLWATLMANPLVLVTTLISAGVMAYDAYNKKIEEASQRFDDLKTEVSEIESELSSLNTELQTTVKRMNELESKDTLTFTEKEEYDNLVKQNNELQRSIDLLELEQKTKNKELNKAFVDTMVSDTQDQFEYTKDDAGNIFVGNSALYNMSGGSFSASDEKEFIEKQFALYKEYSEKMSQLNKETVGATEERKAEIKAEIESLETSISKIETYLSSKSTEFSTTASDIHYISNPTTEDEKAVNEWLDYIADFQDRMANALGGTNAKENAFNRLVDNWQFDKTVQGLQDLGVKGKVTADMLDDPKYDEFIAKLVELGVIDSTDNLDDIALAFNKVTESVDTTNRSIASFDISSLKEEVSSYEDAYSKLTSAQEEYLEAGSLSTDTFIALQESGLLEYLEFTSEGLTVNKDRLLENAQASKDKAVADLHAAMMSDMLQIALGNVDNISEQAQSVIAQLGNNTEIAGQQALSSVANWATLGDTIATVIAQAEGEDPTNVVSKKQKQQMSEVYNYYKNLAKSVGAIDITSKTRTSGGSSTKDATQDFKKLLDAHLNLYEAELNAGIISFDNFLTKSRAMLDQYYAEGKISAEDYWGYIEDLYKKQLDVYDKVLSAVERRFDREIDKIKDTIEEIEKQNDALEKQKDEYDSILSVVEDVYDKKIDSIKAEQDAIQDTIDKLQNENDERQRQIDLEKAKYQLQQSLNNRTVKLYNGTEFVYTTNADEVKEVQQNLADLELEETISALEKEKEALDTEIEKLEEFKQKWQEVANVYETEVNKQLAISLWGKNYEEMILSNRISDIESFKNNYISIQQQIENNQGLIDSYNEKITYYEGLKEQWSSIATAYQEAQEDMLASQILGANWEVDILSGRIDTLNTFANNYNNIQQQMANAEIQARNASINAINAQIQAYKQLQDAANRVSYTPASTGSAFMYDATTGKTKNLVKVTAQNSKYNLAAKKLTDKTIYSYKYASGTEDAKPGIHQVSENGDEIILDNYGNAVLAQGHQLHAFEGGETVINSKETIELLKNQGRLVPVESLFDRIDASKFIDNMPNITPNIHVPNYDFVRMNQNTTPIVQNINLTLPNVTNNSGYERLKKELHQMQLDALQLANKRH